MCGAFVGTLPSCSGGFDLSSVTTGWMGSTWTIVGTAFRDIDVAVNSEQNLGFGFANQADAPNGGLAGDFFDLGQGNRLSHTITPNESGVIASRVPEPGVAGLLAVAVLAASATRRRR